MKIPLLSLWLPYLLTLTSCAFIQPTEVDVSEKAAASTPAVTPASTEAKAPVPAFRRRVLLTNFLNKSRYGGEDLLRYATAHVRETLQKHPEFSIVPQEDVPGSENFLDEYGEYSVKNIITAARAQNISGIILATIVDLNIRQSSNETGLFRTQEYSTIAKVKVQLIDTGTEREIMSQVNSAEVNEEHTDFFQNRRVTTYESERGKAAVIKAMDRPVAQLPDLLKKIAWVGRIAKVEFHRFYINAGELTGINRGHLLKVFGEGQVIRDPENGTMLGLAPGVFKGFLRVIDHFGLDGSIAVIHSGGGFREKDRVELYIAQKKS